VSGNANNEGRTGAVTLNSNNDSTNSNDNIGGALSIFIFINPALPLGKKSDATKRAASRAVSSASKIAES
jgi:hypothetical protein